MVDVLLVVLGGIALTALVVALRRARGSRHAAHGHRAAVREAQAVKAATDRAVIARQGGQGAGQGGVGGGMGF